MKLVIVLSKNGSKQYKKNAIDSLIQSSVQKEARVSHAIVDFLAFIGFLVSLVALQSTLYTIVASRLVSLLAMMVAIHFTPVSPSVLSRVLTRSKVASLFLKRVAMVDKQTVVGAKSIVRFCCNRPDITLLLCRAPVSSSDVSS